jgi:hypothetical protein
MLFEEFKNKRPKQLKSQPREEMRVLCGGNSNKEKKAGGNKERRARRASGGGRQAATATKRGRRRGRYNDLTISHEESWALGGSKQRNN